MNIENLVITNITLFLSLSVIVISFDSLDTAMCDASSIIRDTYKQTVIGFFAIVGVLFLHLLTSIYSNEENI
jgi:hypothetical protein